MTEWSSALYDAQDKLLAFDYDCVILDLQYRYEEPWHRLVVDFYPVR